MRLYGSIVSAIAALLAAEVAGSVPPPPPPPPVIDDPSLRARVEVARACVGDRTGMSEAMWAVETPAPPAGSPAWVKARALVAAYVATREAGRRCIGDLERARQDPTISSRDRAILVRTERDLLVFWLTQSDFEAGTLANLVGLPTDTGDLPFPMLYAEPHDRP